MDCCAAAGIYIYILNNTRNFLYRDMKCGKICLSHEGQLPVLHRCKGSQHFMNQAKFHSTFPILLLLKSLVFEVKVNLQFSNKI